MRQRTQRRRRKRAENAVARGDEPPDPVTAILSSAAFWGSVASAGITTGVTALAGGFSKPKAPAMPKLGATKSPLAGESTKLTPGQKVNAINTTPQGLLEPASTARNTLLGN